MQSPDVDAEIFTTLMTHLKNYRFFPPLKIAGHNVPFPATGEEKPQDYLETYFIQDQTETLGINSLGSHKVSGIFQVTLNWSSTTGIRDPLRKAGEIIVLFKMGTKLFSNGLKVRVSKKPWSVLLPPKDGSIAVAITIPYETFSE